MKKFLPSFFLTIVCFLCIQATNAQLVPPGNFAAVTATYGSVSNEAQLTVTATALTVGANISFTPSSNYQIKVGAGSYALPGAAVIVTDDGAGNLNTTLTIRLAAIATNHAGFDNGDVFIASSNGNATALISCVVSPLNISYTTLPSLDPRNYTGDLAISALSKHAGTTSLNNGAYNQTVTVQEAFDANYTVGAGGSATGKVANDYSANVNPTINTVSAGGFTSDYTISNVTLTNLSITAKPITVTYTGGFANDKVYDGSLVATVSTAPSLSGVVSGDAVSLLPVAQTYSFASKNYSAAPIAVTPDIAYSIAGADAGNYSLTLPAPALSAHINKKSLGFTTTTAISDKMYDGDNICHTIQLGNITGYVLGESLGLVVTPSASYPSKDVGNYTPLVTYNLANNGAILASNYSLAAQNISAKITAKPLTITGSTIAGVTYNGALQHGAVTIGSVTGYVSGETLNITATAASYGVNAGPYTSTITYVLADNLPYLAGNYSVAAEPNVSATIFKKTLNMTQLPTIDDKVYDGNSHAGTLHPGVYSSGIVLPDAVPSIATAASDYSYSAAGIHYSSTVTYTLTGPASGNYSITAVTLNDLKILKKDVTVSFASPKLADKQYDGNAHPPVSVSGVTVLGTISGETLNVTATGTDYASADANILGDYTSDITVDITNGNAWSGNYNLTGSVTFPAVHGKIVPKPLTVATTTVADKEYDLTAIVNPATVSLGAVTGLVGTEDLQFSPVVPITLYGNYVGTYNINIPLSIQNGVSATPGKASNYTATAYNCSVKITPKKLTLIGANSLNTIDKKTYDGTKATGAVTVGKTFTGTIGGQVVTISAVGEFTGPTAGDYNAVNQPCILKYTVNDGPTFDKGFNYAIDDEAGYTAQVDKRKVTITGLKAGNKKKADLDAAAPDYSTPITGTAALKNVVASDAGHVGVTETPAAVTAKFDDANIGQGKHITLTNTYALNGSRASNYEVDHQPVLTATVYSGDSEIGDRVWDDANADGIQDEDELGIAGVKVSLFANNATKDHLADAITDTHGYFLFSPNVGPLSTSSIYGVVGLSGLAQYIVRVPDVSGPTKQVVLGTKNLTVYEQGTDRTIDSDGQLVPEGADALLASPGTGVDFDDADFGFTSGAPSGGGSGGSGGGGVSGGGVGGLESKSLGDAVGNRVFFSAINSTNVVVDYTKLPAISKIGIQRAVTGVGTKLTLKELLPTQINGTSYKAFASTPKDLTAITNAKEVMSIDFTSNNQAKAVAFGMITAGEVYDHTKAICDRLKGAELQSVQSVLINKVPMVSYKLKNNLGQTEYVMSFVVGAKTGRNFYTVQSNWLNKDYAVDEIMYNVQLWAATPEVVSTMATDILSRLAAGQTVVEVPSTKALPTTYLTKGKRSSDKIAVEVNNQSAVTNGYFEIAEKSNEQTATLVKKQIPFTLNANGLTSINIPTSDVYESTLSLYLNGVLQDEVFISDGNWAAQVNSSTSTIKSLKVSNDPTFVAENKDDFKLFRNVQVEASTPDYVSVYKMLRGGGAPQDLTGYKSFQFTAKGTGATMFITLVKDGIPNWADQYSLSMPLSSTSQDYKISLDDFVSTATKDKIDPKDVTMVIFGLAVNGGRLADISADISKVSFSKTDIAYLNSLQSKEIGVYPNPAKGGSFVASFKAPAASMLMMNVTDASTGKLIFTKSVNAQMGTNNVPVHINQQVGLSTYILSLEGSGVKYTPKKVLMEK